MFRAGQLVAVRLVSFTNSPLLCRDCAFTSSNMAPSRFNGPQFRLVKGFNTSLTHPEALSLHKEVINRAPSLPNCILFP